MFKQCAVCGDTVADESKFCPNCGNAFDASEDRSDFLAKAKHYVSEAADELAGAGKDLAESDATKKIAGGAAIGALAGIPIVGWAAGAAIGAGIVAYRVLGSKNNGNKEP